jgi:hypothetical protein
LTDPTAGAFSGNIQGPEAGAAFLIVSLSVGDVLGAGSTRVFALPRMAGKPCLPLPMITTFELVDCES